MSGQQALDAFPGRARCGVLHLADAYELSPHLNDHRVRVRVRVGVRV